MSIHRYSGMVTIGLVLVAYTIYSVFYRLTLITSGVPFNTGIDGAVFPWVLFVIGIFVAAYGLFGGIRGAVRGGGNSFEGISRGTDDSTDVVE